MLLENEIYVDANDFSVVQFLGKMEVADPVVYVFEEIKRGPFASDPMIKDGGPHKLVTRFRFYKQHEVLSSFNIEV